MTADVLPLDAWLAQVYELPLTEIQVAPESVRSAGAGQRRADRKASWRMQPSGKMVLNDPGSLALPLTRGDRGE